MKKITLFLLFTLSLSASATDIYKLNYTAKDTSCTLLKNEQEIPLIDKRFNVKNVKNSYTCASIQKEQYKSCVVKDQKSLTAVTLSYGVFGDTNLIISFRNTHKTIDASIEARCSKTEILK